VTPSTVRRQACWTVADAEWQLRDQSSGSGATCRRLLGALPAWFGIAEAVESFVAVAEWSPEIEGRRWTRPVLSRAAILETAMIEPSRDRKSVDDKRQSLGELRWCQFPARGDVRSPGTRLEVGPDVDGERSNGAMDATLLVKQVLVDDASQKQDTAGKHARRVDQKLYRSARNRPDGFESAFRS